VRGDGGAGALAAVATVGVGALRDKVSQAAVVRKRGRSDAVEVIVDAAKGGADTQVQVKRLHRLAMMVTRSAARGQWIRRRIIRLERRFVGLWVGVVVSGNG
jgi:hypothetical protein